MSLTEEDSGSGTTDCHSSSDQDLIGQSSDKISSDSIKEFINNQTSINDSIEKECYCLFTVEAFKALTNGQLTDWLEILGLPNPYLIKCKEYRFSGGDLLKLGCRSFMNYLGAYNSVKDRLLRKKIILATNVLRNFTKQPMVIDRSSNSSNGSMNTSNLSTTSSPTTPDSPLVSPSDVARPCCPWGSDNENYKLCNNPLHIILLWKSTQESIGLQNDLLKCKHHHVSFYDRSWIRVWLSEVVGLPQYVEAFESIVIADARFLYNISLRDLMDLGVKTEYHAISLRRAIQALDAANYDLNRFVSTIPPMTSSPTSSGCCGVNSLPLWSNRCVGEWLRSIHLSEFVVSLRGSGVHGALMAFEPRFEATLMALLLKIPGNRTLLRRHLGLELSKILGSSQNTLKRDGTNTLDLNRKLTLAGGKTSLLSKIKGISLVRSSLRMRNRSTSNSVGLSPQNSRENEADDRYCRLSRVLPNLEVPSRMDPTVVAFYPSNQPIAFHAKQLIRPSARIHPL